MVTDLIKFKLGFVGQVDTVDVYDGENGFLGNFKNKTQAYDQLSDGDIRDTLRFEPKVEPKPWKQVVSIGKAMIRNILDGSGCDKYRIYVDGQGNFRHDIANIKPYKGTRSGVKPFYYDRIEKWLIEDMKAVVIEDIECDDAVCIAMNHGFKKGLKYVGATTDKDARGTVGWLYNYDKMDEPEFIDVISAERAFYTQMLTGDSIDNIQGCRQAGAACKEAKLIAKSEDVQEMFELVSQKYIDKAVKSGLVRSYRDDSQISVVDEFLENARLLRMITWKDPKKLWHPVADGGIELKSWSDFVSKSGEVDELWE